MSFQLNFMITFSHLTPDIDCIQIEGIGGSLKQQLKRDVLFLVKTKKEGFGTLTLYLYDMFVAKIARFHQSCPSVLSSPLEVIGSREIL